MIRYTGMYHFTSRSPVLSRLTLSLLLHGYFRTSHPIHALLGPLIGSPLRKGGSIKKGLGYRLEDITSKENFKKLIPVRLLILVSSCHINFNLLLIFC